MTDRTNADYAAFLLRLSLGVMYLAHGLMKFVIFTPAGSAAFFEGLGLPGIIGYATLYAEILGGLALILGVGTRLVAAALIPVLIGSIAFVHGGKGWVFSAEGGGWEYSAFLIAASLVQILLGSGAFALRGRAGATSALTPVTA
ncbi:MAG TPA: DoxX family protein [Allosphingosinicella sp.]|jgi:putative oxidoreductase